MRLSYYRIYYNVHRLQNEKTQISLHKYVFRLTLVVFFARWNVQNYSLIEQKRWFCKLNISYKDESFRKLEISTKQEKENYRETAPYLEYRATTVCIHLRRTKQGSAQENFFTYLASQQTKTKLYFPSQAGKHNLNFGRSPLNHYRLLFGNGVFNFDLIGNV